MNYFMFLPQVNEVDTFNESGQQTDDINSVIEYVRVALGYDKTADDEDDDNGNSLALVRTCDSFYQEQITTIGHPYFSELAKLDFSEKRIEKPKTVSYDIISPPPEA